MTRVLLVTKGHPFHRDAFFSVFDANPEITWTHVEQPLARVLLGVDHAHRYDVVVAYDMPGIAFTRGDPPAAFEDPGPFADQFTALLDAGRTGFVFLHHAIAGWPAWEDYAHIVGGRFHYQPATLDGTSYPDSGYRHDVTHTVEVLDPTHPLCRDLPPTFEITDELYCAPIFESAVDPLLRTAHDMDASGFFSSDLAIRGHRYANDGWSHPRGSALVGWVKHAGTSPVAYVQFGDGPDTYADPHYRTVLANAIRWAASPDAKAWAAARRVERGTFA